MSLWFVVVRGIAGVFLLLGGLQDSGCLWDGCRRVWLCYGNCEASMEIEIMRLSRPIVPRCFLFQLILLWKLTSTAFVDSSDGGGDQ